MNIWVLSHGELLPMEPGFHPMRTAMLTAELRKRGHFVTWWTSAFSHRRRFFLADRATTLELDPYLQVKLLCAGGYRSTVSIARHLHNKRLADRFLAAAPYSSRPDFIIASYPIIELAEQAVNFALKYNVPALVDVRDYWPDLYLDRIPAWCRYPARLALCETFKKAKRTLANADMLIGISTGILRFALRHAGRDLVPTDRVFPIGCPASSLSNSEAGPPPRITAEEGVFTCAFVGTLGSSYDLDTVLRSAARLWRAAGGAIRFVIIGDGDNYKRISQLATSLPNVVVTGWVANTEVEGILAQSDVALMPLISRADSLPNKFFEYLRAGIPIVSSLKGEVEDLLSEHNLGYSYRCGDDGELARIIQDMARNREAVQAMGYRCRSLFDLRYTSESIYPAYADHIEQFPRKYTD
jgi:glycosyltransferase involved in cell wall biosynthesis